MYICVYMCMKTVDTYVSAHARLWVLRKLRYLANTVRSPLESTCHFEKPHELCAYARVYLNCS